MAVVPDPWSTPTQPLASPLFTAAAPGGAGGMDFGQFLNTLKGKTKDTAQQAAEKAGQMKAAYAKRPGMYSTLAGAALAGGAQALQGDVLGAAASTAGGLAGGGVGTLLANLAPGPLKPVARAVLPLAGGLFGGAAAQQAAAGMGQKVEESKTGSGGADVSIPSTGITPEIPLSDAARERIQRGRDLQYEVQRQNQLGQSQLGLDRQAMMDQVNSYVQLQKALQPLAERTMRQQLVNQQALINTQSAAYQTLGRQAGMFKLAGTGMEQAGATLRTAISANPYAGATLQAPSISFG